MTPASLSLARRAVAALPPARDRMLARAVGPLWCALDGRRRRAIEANRAALAFRFPTARPFERYLESLLGWLRLLDLEPADIRARTTIEGLGPVERAAQQRRGTVLVAAHVGEWEWGAAALAAAGLPVVAVAGVQMRAAWTPVLRQAKSRLGVEVVAPDASPVRLARALRQGAVVALLVDGDVVTARAAGSIGGHSVDLPLGPARLASRFGARLVAGRCRRDAGDPGRYRIELTPLDDPHATPALDEAALHARVAAWLDSVLHEVPGEWCLFRRFFIPPTPPAAAVA
ncbi:MAG: lysophospholipid acyltransferase family protein [Candidatus Eisenbacteria bacterium]